MDLIRQEDGAGGKVSLENLAADARVRPLLSERGFDPARVARLPGVRLFFRRVRQSRGDGAQSSPLHPDSPSGTYPQ